MICNGASPVVANCTINGNTASVCGGIICMANADPGIANSVFVDNRAVAVYEQDVESDATLSFCLFSANSDGDYLDESSAKYFGAERQIGVLLHDGYDSGVPPRCEWAVGVFNGINSRTAHGVGPSMIYEPPTDPEQGRGLHPEVVFRLGYNHGGINTTGEGDLEGGPFRFAVSLGGAVDFAPVFAEDWGIRGAADALIKAHGFSLAGTFYVATVQDGPTLGDQRLGALGAWAATGYVIKKRVEIAGQYAAVIPAQEGEPVHEVRGGVNVFILGRRVQWRTDGGVVLGRDDAGATTDIQMRSILQMTL